jgi:hypothetical protein
MPRALATVRYVRRWYADDSREVNAIPNTIWQSLTQEVRREYLDRTLFWTTVDLEAKLTDFQHYYNGHRRILGWKEVCQNRLLMDRHHQSISNPTGGEDIVEACIRLQSPRNL